MTKQSDFYSTSRFLRTLLAGVTESSETPGPEMYVLVRVPRSVKVGGYQLNLVERRRLTFEYRDFVGS